jgi:hypothetical protein
MSGFCENSVLQEAHDSKRGGAVSTLPPRKGVLLRKTPNLKYAEHILGSPPPPCGRATVPAYPPIRRIKQVGGTPRYRNSVDTLDVSRAASGAPVRFSPAGFRYSPSGKRTDRGARRVTATAGTRFRVRPVGAPYASALRASAIPSPVNVQTGGHAVLPQRRGHARRLACGPGRPCAPALLRLFVVLRRASGPEQCLRYPPIKERDGNFL